MSFHAVESSRTYSFVVIFMLCAGVALRACGGARADAPVRANHVTLTADGWDRSDAEPRGHRLLGPGDGASQLSAELYDLAVISLCNGTQDYVPDTGGGIGPCLQNTFDGAAEVCGPSVFTGVDVEVSESQTDNGDGTTTVIVQAASADGSAMIRTGTTCDGGNTVSVIGCDLAKQDAGGPGVPGDPLVPDGLASPFELVAAEAVVFGPGGQELLAFDLNSAGTTPSVLKDRFTVGGADVVPITALQFRYVINTGEVCKTLPGDMNGDGVVTGADMGAYVDCAVQPNGGCECADMDFSGTVDENDTGVFVAALLELGQLYTARIPPTTATITTDAGDQTATVEGEMRVRMMAPDGNGVRAIEVEELILGTTSVSTAAGDTGGMSFLANLEASSGTWNMVSGDFNLSAEMVVGYPRIHEVFNDPGPEDPQDDTENDAREFWGAFLTGIAGLEQGSPTVRLDGDLTIDVIEGITEEVTRLTMPISDLPLPPKVHDGPAGCAARLQCNKRTLCLQPIFVRDDAGMNAAGSSFAVMQAAADALWGKCCVEFEWRPVMFVDNSEYLDLDDFELPEGRAKRDMLRAEVDPMGEDDCVEVYFVEEFTASNGDPHFFGDGVAMESGTKSVKLIMADAAVDDCMETPEMPGLVPATRVLAHEIGHAMNLKHEDLCIMVPGGNTPECPSNPSELVSLKFNCKRLRNPLLKEKAPKEACCKVSDCFGSGE